MTRSLLLFDDEVARGWDPFSLTRPVGELLFGALLLRERAERYWGTPCLGHLSRDALVGFSEPGSPPVLGESGLSRQQPRILQVSRAALTGPAVEPGKRAVTLVLAGEVVGWILPPEGVLPSPERLLRPEPIPGSETREVTGRLLGAPWELMSRNGDQLRDDIPRFFPGYAAGEMPGCHILGDGLLSLGRGVEVEPGSVFDVRNGPIRLSDGVVVRSHTRLAGPAFVGPGATLLGGVLSEVSIGPASKIRGEVETSVVLGWSNKAHDGFLGHAYLGRWVNLGAMTTNSDLKNNYGPVRLGSPGGPRDTGLIKVGCFLGDHVKTGIGTLLNTGTMVGAGSNLFGGVMPPIYVPPFSWGTGADLVDYQVDKFLEVARIVMARRKVSLDPGMEAVLRRAWSAARSPAVPSE